MDELYQDIHATRNMDIKILMNHFIALQPFILQKKIFFVEFLRDMVEVLLYILLPANEFRCIPARVLLRVCRIRF